LYNNNNNNNYHYYYYYYDSCYYCYHHRRYHSPPPPLDQLMKATYVNGKRSNKNLSIACIDYQKAFNSIPHSWVETSIELVGVNSKIVKFCKSSVEKWNNASVKNKARRNAVAAHFDTKRNIRRDCC